MKKQILIVCLLLLALLLAGCGSSAPPEPTPDEGATDAAAAEAAEAFLAAVSSGDLTAAQRLSEPALSAPPEAATEAGRLVAPLLREPSRIEARGELRRSGEEATLTVALFAPDPQAIGRELGAAMQAALDERMAAAMRTDEVLNADLSVREDLLPALEQEALARSAEAEREAVERGTAELRLRLSGGVWRVVNADEALAALWGGDCDALAADFLSEAAAGLQTAPKHYTMPLDMKIGQPPDPAGYGMTDDPEELLAVLARPEAQRLLEGKELIWRPDIERYPDSHLYYYLDESILVIVWQEITAWACGTYAEVITADGSQLGRRLSDDSFESDNDYTPTEFAGQTQAVLVIGGDFYRYPGRYNGICVYEGQIYRFEPDSSDCCFVTDQGDLLLIKRGQFLTQEDAEAYIEENHVRFSLCFGPAVIENGEDIMPERYRWGEIYDRYARAMLGRREELHYLACTINAKAPGYYNLVTLRDAVDAMMAHGCTLAYTLDGGRTATICLGGEIINTVQSGVERPMSDVVFFASALPPEVEG